MHLDVMIDDNTLRIEIPPDMPVEAEAFFGKMEQDMDRGWQMGPDYVERPDTTQRCQIAANKLLASHAARNTLVMQLMAAYILRRMPAVKRVNIDTGGEMLNTRFHCDDGQNTQPRSP